MRGESLKKTSLITIILVSFVLAGLGCATTQTVGNSEQGGMEGEAQAQQESTPKGKVEYGVFFTPSEHVIELMKKNDLDGASNVYEENKNHFTPPGKKEGLTLDQVSTFIRGIKKKPRLVANDLAIALQNKYTTEINGYNKRLMVVNWPAPSSQWESIERLLQRSSDLKAEIDSHEILADLHHLPTNYSIFANNINSLSNKIKNAADTQFAQYPLNKEPSFFSIYPVKINGHDFLEKHSEQVVERLEKSDAKSICDFFNIYQSYLTDDTKQQVAVCHLESSIKKHSQGKPPNVMAVLAGISDTTKAGLPLKEVPSSKVALIDVTSKALKKEKQIEFPIALDINLPIQAKQVELDKAFDNPMSQKTDLLVVLNIVAAKITRKVSKASLVKSTFQSGSRQLPNPDYGAAQAAVTEAQNNLTSARISAATSGNTGHWIGNIASGIIHGAIIGSARKKLNEAVYNLRNTPAHIDEPVYSKYQFRVANIDVAKEGVVYYYVVDRQRKVYTRGIFDAKQTQQFVVAYNLREEDAQYWKLSSKYETEQDIEKMEQEPLEVKLSDILDRFTSKPGKTKKMPSLVALRTDMLKEKNRALVKHEKEKYYAKPRDDRRFKSVVVVYHPGGGLGTGFYVKDDLVLTNYHVIEGSKYVEMKTYDGQETFGKVVASDVRLDLALIKVQSRGIPLQFSKEKTLPLGDTVEAVGHPKGLEFSITRGVISALRKIDSRFTPGGKKILFVQSDVAINPGNSGGPLFLGKKVVGVNTQKLAATELEGLGFSIHFSEVNNFLRDYLNGKQ